MKTQPPPCVYRLSIKGLIIRDGKIFLQYDDSSKHGHPASWQLPGGGLNYGEGIREAMQRELHEENGLKLSRMDDRPLYTWSAERLNRRGYDRFYAMVMCYAIDVESLDDFTPTKEAEKYCFASVDDMKEINLNGQITPLLDLFDPDHFTK